MSSLTANMLCSHPSCCRTLLLQQRHLVNERVVLLFTAMLATLIAVEFSTSGDLDLWLFQLKNGTLIFSCSGKFVYVFSSYGPMWDRQMDRGASCIMWLQDGHIINLWNCNLGGILTCYIVMYSHLGWLVYVLVGILKAGYTIIMVGCWYLLWIMLQFLLWME